MKKPAAFAVVKRRKDIRRERASREANFIRALKRKGTTAVRVLQFVQYELAISGELTDAEMDVLERWLYGARNE